MAEIEELRAIVKQLNKTRLVYLWVKSFVQKVNELSGWKLSVPLERRFAYWRQLQLGLRLEEEDLRCMIFVNNQSEENVLYTLPVRNALPHDVVITLSRKFRHLCVCLNHLLLVTLHLVWSACDLISKTLDIRECIDKTRKRILNQ